MGIHSIILLILYTLEFSHKILPEEQKTSEVIQYGIMYIKFEGMDVEIYCMS